MSRVDDIKKELQGKKGLISLVKSGPLPFPSPDNMISRTHRHFKDRFSFDDPDWALGKLMEIEYEVYKEIQSEWLDEFWGCAASMVARHQDRFPVLHSIFDDYNEGGRRIGSDEMMIGMVVGQSMSQSGRTRAGHSLMEHIGWLLEKKGILKGEHFQREVPMGSVRLDFLFPNKEHFERDRSSCITCAAMTTMNDRYRLALQQLQENTFQRVLTAIGSSNFSERLGPGSLTQSKLDAVRKKGAKVVVIGPALDSFNDEDPVMSYSDWFDEVARLKGIWLS